MIEKKIEDIKEELEDDMLSVLVDLLIERNYN